MQENLSAKCWIGIDVAKPWVDVEILVDEQKKEAFRVDRTVEALTQLAQKLLPYCPQGVVLEATGGLEVLVVATLSAAGLNVMRMNPRRVRDFARAQALIAVVRKLLIALNEMMRSNTPWRATPTPIPA